MLINYINGLWLLIINIFYSNISKRVFTQNVDMNLRIIKEKFHNQINFNLNKANQNLKKNTHTRGFLESQICFRYHGHHRRILFTVFTKLLWPFNIGEEGEGVY